MCFHLKTVKISQAVRTFEKRNPLRKIYRAIPPVLKRMRINLVRTTGIAHCYFIFHLTLSLTNPSARVFILVCRGVAEFRSHIQNLAAQADIRARCY